MIEPQSAQLGASAWEVKVTWALPMPRLPRVTRGVPFDIPLVGAEAGEEAAGAVAPVSNEPAVPPLSGEAGPAAGNEPLPEVPALPAPAEPPNPRLSGCTDDSEVDDRSIKPRLARSSAGRKREPIQRKM